MSDSRVIFITGGSRGLGYEFARQYLASGNKVSLLARDQPSLEKIKTHFSIKHPDKIITFPGSVSNYENVKSAVEQTLNKWGRIDIVIANAGQALIGPIDELDPRNIHQQFSVNFTGALYTAFATRPYLKTSHGTFVIIGSVSAYIVTPMLPAYSASKAAVKLYFDAERESFQHDGVAVVQLLPGTIESDILHVRPDNTFDPNYNNPSVSAGGKLIKPASTDAAVSEMITAIQKKQPEQIITLFGKCAVFGIKHMPSFMNKMGINDFEEYIRERDKSKAQSSSSLKPSLNHSVKLQDKVLLMAIYNMSHVEMARQLLSMNLKISLLVMNDALAKEFKDMDENILVNVVNFTNLEDIQNAVSKTLQKWRWLDFVILNSVNIMPEVNESAEVSVQQMNLNFDGAINLSYAAFDALKNSHGRLFILGHQNSFFEPSISPAYSASDVAIRTFFKAARASYENAGISVIQVISNDQTTTAALIDKMFSAIINKEREVFVGLDKKTSDLLTCHAGLFSVTAAKKLHEERLRKDKSSAASSVSRQLP